MEWQGKYWFDYIDLDNWNIFFKWFSSLSMWPISVDCTDSVWEFKLSIVQCSMQRSNHWPVTPLSADLYLDVSPPRYSLLFPPTPAAGDSRECRGSVCISVEQAGTLTLHCYLGHPTNTQLWGVSCSDNFSRHTHHIVTCHADHTYHLLLRFIV